MDCKRRAVIVPIDNRPVTYIYPQMVARVAGIETIAPPRDLMGSLNRPAEISELELWLQERLTQNPPDVLIICLDTLLYGGLVASRRGSEPLEEISRRLEILTQLKAHAKTELLVQSAIMRIPNYDDNTEEPLYWSKYGRKLFAWSEKLHLLLLGKLQDENELQKIEAELTPEVTSDFLWRRKRNHQIQRDLVLFAENKRIDFLIFSQDDSGEYGLNVFEKDQILGDVEAMRIENVIAYPGADEVMLTLISRWLISKSAAPKVELHFAPADGGRFISNFEGQTIADSLRKQCIAAGVEVITPGSGPSDVWVVVHTAGQDQGDHMWLPGHTDRRQLDTRVAVEKTISILESAPVGCILCDVAYANGADPVLMDALFARPDLFKKLISYAGWNTTGNTVGSSLALGIARWSARMNEGQLDLDAWRQCMFVRLADDWAYQTQVRPQLSDGPSESLVEELMRPYLQRIAAALEMTLPTVKYDFPWQRTFEIELGIV